MANKSKKILVTGADGFIGSHLTERLIEAGADVTALAMYNSFDGHGWLDQLSPQLRAQCRLERGDVRDAAFVDSIAKGQDCIFHLAALIAIPHSYVAPHSYIDTNVTGTLNILEAARKHDIGRVVHTSTSEVYGTAQSTPIYENHALQGQSPYSASKIGADMMAEAYARSFDLPVVILRPFNTYGPRQSERAVIPTVIRQVLDPACEAIKVGDLTPQRDFNFVADTVAAFALAAEANQLEMGSPYNAGTGEAHSIGEMIDIVLKLTGSNKQVQRDKTRIRPEKSEVHLLLAGANKFSSATGWTPKTDFQAGLSKTIEWWKERIASGHIRSTSTYAT